jgi:cysteinylglycine-S-conjugate dipeptidase
VRSHLTAAVAAVVPAALDDLESFVSIQSVSADPARADEVRRSAEWVADRCRDLGCPDVQVVSAGSGAPAVIARFPAPAGQPTVCLYAHHDVQPEGDPAQWDSPPFTAARRQGRLYGRGAGDDKAGVMLHLAVLRAFGGRPPVGVTLFVEGEEEVGSPTLPLLLAEHRDALAADVYVIADSVNWDVGQPAFTTSLRGLVDCVVEVRTLDHAIHSGAYGGVAPDALTALCRLIATLHDEAGNVAVAGLHHAPGSDLTYPPDRLRRESGVLEWVRYLGTGSVVERLWHRPALAVIALDATPISRASNTLLPAARAKISLRLAPGDDARQALERLTEHLLAHAPWGARVQVFPGDLGQPYALTMTGPYAAVAEQAVADAWDRPAVHVGQGGSIPMVAMFAQGYPEATVLVTAVCDPDSRMHGPNESVHLGDFAAACQAEAAMLAGFAAWAASPSGPAAEVLQG